MLIIKIVDNGPSQLKVLNDYQLSVRHDESLLTNFSLKLQCCHG